MVINSAGHQIVHRHISEEVQSTHGGGVLTGEPERWSNRYHGVHMVWKRGRWSDIVRHGQSHGTVLSSLGASIRTPLKHQPRSDMAIK